MLAALGRHYSWPRAELEALLAEDAVFYCDAMVALAKSAPEPSP